MSAIELRPARLLGRVPRPPLHRVVAAGLLAAAVTALVVYDARYHEFWRDEVHTYLFNEHVPLHRFLLAKKVEGHPPLYDFLTVPLVPFLLSDVALHPDLMQADGVHPVEAAQPLLLATVWPTLEPLLKR